jgi:hypothetical protein
MPCIVALLALAFPRILLLFIFFTSNYLDRAYHNLLFPFLGFLFLPLTTLAYAWVINSHGSIDGLYLVLVIVAVLVDLGLLGSGERSRRRR